MQVWSILVFAATNQKLVSYETLAKLLGVPTPAVGGFLFPILHYCTQNDLPPLTAIVISHVTGRLGDGFPADLDIFKSQSRSFVYHWLSPNIETPNANHFQAAEEAAA
jgi:putative restriction endonuclease